MSTHKNIDRICCVVIALALVLTVAFMNGERLGVEAVAYGGGYEERLFDTSRVHTIDIVMDDWEGFLDTCTDEEYVLCSLVIDNESYKNVAIRAKGNTSLTQVASYGNDRYSFKIEFDHYDSATTYYGLDKLCLNNIIQDNTYMKDYLTYQMMADFGVDAPLCSFVYITVNGEEWGLYLAVEGVEEAFLERNYGSDYGELYKPDSVSMGGGRGNGAGFDMDDWQQAQEQQAEDGEDLPEGVSQEEGFFPGGGMPFPGGMPGPAGEESQSDGTESETDSDSRDIPEDMGFPGGGEPPEGMTIPEGMEPPENMELPDGMELPDAAGGRGMGGGFGGMGSSGVSLTYTDDDYDSYANIFDNAKTDITDADKDRLIDSLRQLNEGENIEEVVDVDEVIRYFVVHNFVCNFDSYTGSMIHNYYLYEENGQLSMIPWDYNLAFGGFQGAQDATAMVNYPIDTPVSGGTVDSRPMLAWIFADETYTELYHQYFSEFIESYFESGYFEQMMDEVYALIAPYVEKDPTKFCTYEEFETGFAALERFCILRAESVRGQLEGTIPATSDGQAADDSALVDASDLNISDMGSMNGGFGGGMDRGGRGGTGPFGQNGDAAGETAPASTASVDGASDTSPADDQTAGPAESGGETAIQPEEPSVPVFHEGEQPAAQDGEAGQDLADSGQNDTASPAGEAGSQDRQELTWNGETGQERGQMAAMNAAEFGGFPGGGETVTTQQSGDSILLLGICGAVLLLGLAAAALYRKRG